MTTAARVLVVDDAPEYLELLVPLLAREGYDVDTAEDGEAALAAARAAAPDVVVLDVMLPKLDGMEVCRRLRGFSDAYVIMLTGRSDEVDRIVGLEVGADDYLTKPFSPRELLARVRAMLRRPRATTSAALHGPRSFGSLTLDVPGRSVTVGQDSVELTRTEFDLLATLASDPSVVFDRARLRDEVWGPDWYGDDHVVDVHIANLRKKLDRGDGRQFVKTVRGVGYRLNIDT